MVRSELVTALARDHPELDKRTIETIVSVFFDAIVAQLAGGGRVEVRDFGVFSTRARIARVGRDPKTGNAVDVEAKRAVHFKPGKTLRKQVDV